MPAPGGADPLALITTIRDQDGELQHIGWDVDGEGEVRRRGDILAGAVDVFDTTMVKRDGRLFMPAAVRDGTGDLKVIVWEVNPK